MRHVFSSQDDVPKASSEPCCFICEIIRIRAVSDILRSHLSGGSNPTFSEWVNMYAVSFVAVQTIAQIDQ